MIRPIGLLLLAAGCSPPPAVEPTEAAVESVTLPAVALHSSVSASAAPAASASAAAVVVAPTTIERPASCVGTGFDLDKLFSNAVPVGARVSDAEREASCGYASDIADLAPNALPDAIEITIEVQPAPLPPGATGKLVAAFKNVTDQPRTVAFSRACDDPLLQSQLWTADGARADLQPTDYGCGVGRGCMSQYVVVTLEPGGVATASGTYAAKLMRLRKDACEEAPVGPVKAGSYELRTMTPLFYREPHQTKGGSYREARRPLEVKKE